MLRSASLLGLMVVSPVALATVSATELVTNGSFESSLAGYPLPGAGQWAVYENGTLPGWSTDKGPGIEVDYATRAASAISGAVARSGNYLIELDSDTHRLVGGQPAPAGNTNSNAFQYVSTLTGQQYQYSFWYSGRPGQSASTSSLNWLIGNAGGDISVTGGATTNWVQYSGIITATSGRTLIRFMATGTPDTYGGLLDNVSLVAVNQVPAVPEPSLATLFGIGAGIVFLVRRRRD